MSATLSNRPILDLIMSDAQIDALFGKGASARRYMKSLHEVTRAGRSARAVAVPLCDCPPFFNNDMAISWRLGWYDEDMRRDPEGFAKREEEYLRTGLLPHEVAS